MCPLVSGDQAGDPKEIREWTSKKKGRKESRKEGRKEGRKEKRKKLPLLSANFGLYLHGILCL